MINMFTEERDHKKTGTTATVSTEEGFMTHAAENVTETSTEGVSNNITIDMDPRSQIHQSSHSN